MATVRISSKSMRQRFHGCDPDFIRDVCHAACCHSSTHPTGVRITVHRSERAAIEARGGVVGDDGMLAPGEGTKRCPFEGAETHLCGLHFTPDKPVNCITDPFTLSPGGRTLVVRNRYRQFKCYNTGPRLHAYVAFRAGLDLLFGAEQAAAICAHLDAGGGDIDAEMLPRMHDIMVDDTALRKAAPAAELALTPVEQHGDLWLKRDDLYVSPGGAIGGKARSAYALAVKGSGRGLVTAGSKSSPQTSIVARIGRALGLPVRVHTPSGEPGAEIADAIAAGAERVTHRPGYSNVVAARASKDAEALGCLYIPYGMETEEAITQTGGQTENIPREARRVVIAVGSGMSVAGVIAGIAARRAAFPDLELLGVRVGANPARQLSRYVPDWPAWASLETSPVDYNTRVEASVGGVALDPIYEAKAVEYLQDGDLLWVVGHRNAGQPL
jgi:1-aminocyclopropane-1-carboxylate deaminase/D-cysteine desulfhydrase-like pyridoxal-dependent ACC family enzyme